MVALGPLSHLKYPSAKDLDGDADPLAVGEPLGAQELGSLRFQLEQFPGAAFRFGWETQFWLSAKINKKIIIQVFSYQGIPRNMYRVACHLW